MNSVTGESSPVSIDRPRPAVFFIIKKSDRGLTIPPSLGVLTSCSAAVVRLVIAKNSIQWPEGKIGAN